MATDLTDAVSDPGDGGAAAGSTGGVATVPGDGPRPTTRRRAAQVLLLLAPSLLLLERGWAGRWVTDDGFINMRVARMIVEGRGPVFNVGERVEVTTSTLWVWMIAAGDLVLPLRMEWVTVVLGLACAVAGLATATFAAARLHRHLGATGALVPAGALVVAAVAPFWHFSTSGLEGGLTFGWMGATSWLLARWATRAPRSGPLVAAVAGLAPLVRPDLALAVPVVVGGVLFARWTDDRWADRLRVVAAALALPLAYQVFRMGYFASMVPNTALAKSGGRSRWGDGFSYLRDLVQPYWLLVPLVCLGLAAAVPALRRCRATRDRAALVALVTLPVGGLLDGLYVVRVGGDYMHARLLLPALFALLLPVAATPLPRLRPAAGVGATATATGATAATATATATAERHERLGRVLVAGALVATAAWAVMCLARFRPGDTPVAADLFSADAHGNHVQLHGHHAVTTDDQGWGDDSRRVRIGEASPVVVGGVPVDVDPPVDLPTPAYASYGVGIVGYALGPEVHVIDQLGLADPIGSRFELDGPGLTGHEKPMPAAWLAARISDRPVDRDQLGEPHFAASLYESPPGRFDSDTAAARAAARCGDLHDLTGAVREPLSPGRFARNLAGALRFTTLQVPPDPTLARDRFC